MGQLLPVLLIMAAMTAASSGAYAETYKTDSAEITISESYTSTYWSDGKVSSTMATVDGFVTVGGIKHDIEGSAARVLGESLVFETEYLVVYLSPTGSSYEARAYMYTPGRDLISETITFGTGGSGANTGEGQATKDSPTVKVTVKEDTPAQDSEDDGNYIVFTDHSHSSIYYQKFVLAVNVYDGDINADPLRFPSNGGLVDGAAVKVTLIGNDGEQLLSTEGTTKNGLFEYEYSWLYSDRRQSYEVIVDVEDGANISKSYTYYLGQVAQRDDGIPPEIIGAIDLTGEEFVEATGPETILFAPSINQSAYQLCTHVSNDDRDDCVGDGDITHGTIIATDNINLPPILEHDINVGGYNLGKHSITWIATDAARNTAEVIQEIDVQDNTPPMFMGIMNLTGSASVEATGSTTRLFVQMSPLGYQLCTHESNEVRDGCMGNDVEYGSPITATDIVSSATITNDIEELVFDLGSHIITWTAMDEEENSVTSPQMVTIQDNTDPDIMGPSDITCTSSSNIMLTADLAKINATDLVDDMLDIEPDMEVLPNEMPVMMPDMTDPMDNENDMPDPMSDEEDMAPDEMDPINEGEGATGTGTDTGTDMDMGTDTDTGNTITTYTVNWTATDDSGNSSEELTQTILVEYQAGQVAMCEISQ